MAKLKLQLSQQDIVYNRFITLKYGKINTFFIVVFVKEKYDFVSIV